ncbi:winged helix-turn-helix domain-containing protein [Burkholderia cenocepacia]|uniref:winged helix-turn-helix domain-containing protein n=1 Tax=Burkholderia cenocepacia TaxID=95486 RepID=UPI00264BC56F|nr:winged helix-turn-helix domain-containing protein [Burkholderia cenocepacia]MDN7544796.1 winged helix-turn-helix domain-containing protein [Burkholderia cenocepacia]MDN7626973.1 winged helix-turn-helix domain-containing protein [Burkholderia cenocepacia]
MAERKMTLLALQILKALEEHPNVTVVQLAEKMGRVVDAIRRPTRRLIADEYITRGRRLKGGSRLKLSGKPFPSVESYSPIENAVAARHRRIEEGFAQLVPAMRAFVEVGQVGA